MHTRIAELFCVLRHVQRHNTSQGDSRNNRAGQEGRSHPIDIPKSQAIMLGPSGVPHASLLHTPPNRIQMPETLKAAG